MTSNIIVKYPKKVSKITFNQAQKIYFKYFKDKNKILDYNMSLLEMNKIISKEYCNYI